MIKIQVVFPVQELNKKKLKWLIQLTVKIRFVNEFIILSFKLKIQWKWSYQNIPIDSNTPLNHKTDF